jgi:RNA polymerase sigma-70 factor, ECF subfamily
MSGGIENIADSNPVEMFERYRPLLFSIAYDILGIEADAERIVQETLTQWLALPNHAIEKARTLLVVAIASRCIGQLQHTQQDGVQISACPFATRSRQRVSPDLSVVNSMPAALLVMLDHLTPTERITFILRTVFHYGYSQIARTVGRDEAQCRRIVQRIKRYMVRNRSVIASPSPPDVSQI